MEFKLGDIVTLDHNATIEDFVKNHWNGCKLSTLDFIRDNANGETHKVIDTDFTDECVELSNYLVVNANILKLVKRPVRNITVKLTQEELEKVKEILGDIDEEEE